MKLSGDVKWVVGLVFERNIEGDKRLSEFKPHYDVVLRNSKFVDASQQQVWITMHLLLFFADADGSFFF